MRFRIGVLGLGKLGLPCAEVFARHHDVVGFDVVDRTSESVQVVRTLEAAVADRDIVFIAVPTAHEPAYGGASPISHLPPKDFDYGVVQAVVAEANKYTSDGQLVVLISTVLPGTIRQHVAPLLTTAPLVYNPYLIAMGSVEWDVIHPEMVIIGTEDGRPAELLQSFYRTFVQCDRYAIGTYEEAECIKIFYNTFISMKIGFANMVQDVAERNGHINADVVCDALKMAAGRGMTCSYRFRAPSSLSCQSEQRPCVVVPARSFRSGFGSLETDTLRVRLDSAVGHIIYGPYMQLPVGGYRAEFLFEIANAIDAGEARLTLDIAAGAEPYPETKQIDPATWHRGSSAALTFRHDRPGQKVEFRVHARGFAAGELAFRGVVIDRFDS